jgi:hypothetical protein
MSCDVLDIDAAQQIKSASSEGEGRAFESRRGQQSNRVKGRAVGIWKGVT